MYTFSILFRNVIECDVISIDSVSIQINFICWCHHQLQVISNASAPHVSIIPGKLEIHPIISQW